MMEAQSEIVVALERAGFDPCPAIDIAQRAMRIAWEVWNEQAAEIERLKTRGGVPHAGRNPDAFQ